MKSPRASAEAGFQFTQAVLDCHGLAEEIPKQDFHRRVPLACDFLGFADVARKEIGSLQRLGYRLGLAFVLSHGLNIRKRLRSSRPIRAKWLMK